MSYDRIEAVINEALTEVQRLVDEAKAEGDPDVLSDLCELLGSTADDFVAMQEEVDAAYNASEAETEEESDDEDFDGEEFLDTRDAE